MSGLSAAVLAVIGLANGVIGACIGICGIAGISASHALYGGPGV